MTTKRKPEIDSKAAPCTGQDDALKRAMMDLRKPRKPRQTAPETKPGPKAKPKSRAKNAKQEKLEGLQDAVVDEKFTLSGQLTMMELRFIEFYLTGDLTVDKAMESAGYKGYHRKSLYRLGRKIVEKYENQAGEHRKTFRAVGAGEVSVAQGLLKLATTAKSEMVRLNSWIAIGKILGLTQDVVAVNQGIQIVIKGRGDDSGRPAVQVRQEASRVPPRTMAITK